MFTTNYSLTGVFNLIITVTDPKTKIEDSNLLFKVTILCTKQIVVESNPIPNLITYTINKTKKIVKNLSLPIYKPSPAGCAIGTFSYLLLLIDP